MMKQLHNIVFAVLMTVVAVSCTSAKHCAEPELNLPERFLLADSSNAADSNPLADMAWRGVYSDTLLQNLIKRTLLYNKDLLIASERVEQMRYLHRMDKASLWPSLSARMGGDHEWENYGGIKPTIVTEPSARLDLSWEIDLWGHLRNAAKQGAAEYLSSLEARRAMQMTLIAEVATAYFELVALDNQLEIVQQTAETRNEEVQQAKIRFEGGLTSETSYQQAQVELATAAATIPELKRKITIQESRIALLVGSYPDSIARRTSKASMPADSELPIGLPSSLLQRRPDLRQAEARLQAAEAAVGIAHAERFPRLTINLTTGFENNEFETLLQSPYHYAAANLAAPVFAFGKRKAKFNAAVAAYNQEKLNYEKAVLMAFKEVYDAVISYRAARENTILMRNLKEATNKYVTLAQLQYLNGVIRYIDVLDAYRKDFTAEIDLSNAICDESLAFVALYKALGGGWQN